MKLWTRQEENKLLKLYNELNNDELIKEFNRSYLSIYKKARELGLYKSKEIEFVNRSLANKREKSPSWKGGRKKNQKGYVLILNHEHHRAHVNGYVLEHIMVAETMLGRPLKPNEVVHHKNGIKDDNRPENLEVMDRGQHTVQHHLGSRRTLETRKKISEAKKRRNYE